MHLYRSMTCLMRMAFKLEPHIMAAGYAVSTISPRRVGALCKYGTSSLEVLKVGTIMSTTVTVNCSALNIAAPGIPG